jgi:MarR family transcriptional regulator, lower aerobic nicotinate degradation pathway regulator
VSVKASATRPPKSMRMTAVPDRSLELPARLLEHPSAVMFLLMREAFRLTHRRADPAGAASSDGLRFPHFAVLACLDEFGPSSQKDVSERLRFDASDLVTFVDLLERNGFVLRKRDERDRRRYALEITTAGRRAIRRRDREAARMNDELFAPLGPAERAELRGLLLRTLAHHDPRAAGSMGASPSQEHR